MHQFAEQDGHQRTQHTQRRHPDEHPYRLIRHRHGEAGRLHPQTDGHAVGHQRRQQAGIQRHVVDHADADDHDGKHRGRQGRSEQGGEERRHTRQRSHPEIPVIQPEGAAHTLTDGAAHLKGCALPSRAAAAQVGQNRTEKDGRQQQDRQPLSFMDRVDDIVGTQAVRLRQLVKAHDHKARQRQEIQHPGVRSSESRYLMDAEVEHGPDQSADHADGGRSHGPFCKRPPVKTPPPQSGFRSFVHCMCSLTLPPLFPPTHC